LAETHVEQHDGKAGMLLARQFVVARGMRSGAAIGPCTHAVTLLARLRLSMSPNEPSA
jgi:hypothetical protein